MKRKWLHGAIVAAALTVLFALLTAVGCSEKKTCSEHIYWPNYSYNDKEHYNVCKVCGYKTDVSEHTYGEFVVTEEPTIEAVGTGYYACATCRYKKEETFDNCEHEYTFVESTASTCSSSGHYEHYVCEKCGAKFNSDYRKVPWVKLLKTTTAHSFGIRNAEVRLPTYYTVGNIRIKCSDFEECGGYLKANNTSSLFIFPKTSETEYYNQKVKNGVTYYTVKSSYIKDNIVDGLNSYMYDNLVSLIEETEIPTSVCDVRHDYAVDGFVNLDNKLYFVCVNDASHLLEIEIPDVSEGVYTKTERKASCCEVGGDEYRLTVAQWIEILTPYEDELTDLDSSYHIPSSANRLSYGFAIFIGNGQLDPDNHRQEALKVGQFIPPTYDLATRKMTAGKCRATCQDCKKEVSEEVEYSSGTWRMTKSGLMDLNITYYRDYVAFGQTLTEKREKLRYVIDLNGGTAIDQEETPVSGEITDNTVFLSKYQFTPDGYKIAGIDLCVDGVWLNSDSDDYKNRVEFKNSATIALGAYDRYFVSIGGSEELLGDVIIKILWQPV